MPRFILNGTAVNYRRAGEGPDLVLIHGLGANHAFWRLDVLLPLARRFHVTTYDLKGHGYSGLAPSGYTSADLASDLKALLDHLGIGRAHLVGHSFGGIIALQCAARHPELVRSLTIVDSRLRALQENLTLSGWPDWDALQGVMRDLGIDIPDDATDGGIDALDRLADPGVRSRLQEVARLGAFEGYVPFGGPNGGSRSAERWLELTRTTTAGRDFRDRAGLTREMLRRIDCPTLALYGEASHCLESGRGLRALLPHCRVATVPGAGHYFPVTRPQAVVEAVQSFLADLETRPLMSEARR